MTINEKKIQTLIAENNLTMGQFAAACGISAKNIGGIIRRGTCHPRTVNKLAKGLGVPVTDILMGGN